MKNGFDCNGGQTRFLLILLSTCFTVSTVSPDNAGHGPYRFARRVKAVNKTVWGQSVPKKTGKTHHNNLIFNAKTRLM
jgi:hypothetical protein